MSIIYAKGKNNTWSVRKIHRESRWYYWPYKGEPQEWQLIYIKINTTFSISFITLQSSLLLCYSSSTFTRGGRFYNWRSYVRSIGRIYGRSVKMLLSRFSSLFWPVLFTLLTFLHNNWIKRSYQQLSLITGCYNLLTKLTSEIAIRRQSKIQTKEKSHIQNRITKKET